MYTSFNKKENVVGLWKSKFYMPGEVNEPLNKNMARDYDNFWMNEIHTGDYLDKAVLEPLKDNLKAVGNNIYKTLKIVDSYTVVQRDTINYALKYYAVNVLFTFDGDKRPVDKIKSAAQATPLDWYVDNKLTDTCRKQFNVDGYTNLDYMTCICVPYVTDNCTFIYDNRITHNNGELKERYFKLQIRSKSGVYYSYKSNDIKIHLFKRGYKANIYSTKTNIVFEDTVTRYENKKAKVDYITLLYLCSQISGMEYGRFLGYIKELGIPYLYARAEKIENQFQSSTKDNMIAMVQENLLNNLNEITGLQRIVTYKNLIGRELAEDNGLKAGTIITEENYNQLKYSLVKIKSGRGNLLSEYSTIADMPVKLESILKYNKQDIVQQQGGGKFEDYIRLDGDNPIVTASCKLTKSIVNILLDSGYNEINYRNDKKVFMEKLVLTTPFNLTSLTTNNIFYIMYNLLSLYISLKSYDKVSLYNVMRLDASFNKEIITPKHISYEYSCKAIREEITKQRANIKSFLEEYSIAPELLFRDGWEIDGTNPLGTFEKKDNPLGKAFNAEFANFRGTIVSKDLCETVTAASMINPIHYIYNLNEVNTAIKDDNAIDFEQRQLHVAMLGRFDIFEVPMSKKLGVTTSLASGCKIDKEGAMKVPYYRVVNGTITKDIVELEAIDEHKYIILSMTDVDIDDNGNIINLDKPVYAKVASQSNHYESDIALVRLDSIIHNDNILISTTPYSEISWSISAIPFIGNNDSARVTYGVSQLKQAKAIINAEKPFVQTPAWRFIPKLQLPFNTQNKIENFIFNAPGLSQTQHSLNVKYHKDLYSPDEEAEMTSSMIEDGCLKLGLNALVAFIPDGYNYEDAVHIRYDFSNRMASLKIDRNNLGKISRPFMEKDKEKPINERKRISINRISVVPTNETLNIKPHIIKTGKPVLSLSYENKLVPFTYKDEDAGYVLDWHYLKGIEYGKNCFSVGYNVLKSSTLIAGDKLSNRHGNKGVLAFPNSLGDNSEFGAAPSPKDKFPKLNNGKTIDLIYNPLGVMSRMNLGQIYEAQLGLIAKVLNVRFEVNAVASINEDDILGLMKLTYRLANSKGDFDSILNEVDNEELREHIKENELYIKTWANTFDEKGLAEVTYPGIGKIHKKVIIGYIYVNKLIQESESKIASRGSILSVGQSGYETMEAQPNKGRIISGGESYGNMEVDSLMAYGADEYVSNALNERCNNISKRNRYLSNLLGLSNAERKEFSIRRSSQHFIMLMKAFGVEIHSDNTNNDIEKLQHMEYTNHISNMRFLYGNDESYKEDVVYAEPGETSFEDLAKVPSDKLEDLPLNMSLSAVEKMKKIKQEAEMTASDVAAKYGIDSEEYFEWSNKHPVQENEEVPLGDLEFLRDKDKKKDDFDNIEF